MLTDVHPYSALDSTEIFGPVAAIQTFTDLDDAIGRANATDWGLVGYVATQDIDNALNVAERLDVGMVGINTGVVSTRRRRSAASSSPVWAVKADGSASRSSSRPSTSRSRSGASRAHRHWASAEQELTRMSGHTSTPSTSSPATASGPR